MKALILAAGFGTRLAPYTKHTPKPLFPFGDSVLLDRIILSLQNAGSHEIMINTHYLHTQIDDFISTQNYLIPVHTVYEPVILGTGSAIKNIADFWDNEPFVVINSDIITDIDIGSVYDFHKTHNNPATLVLYDDPEFNTVLVNKDNFILDFYGHASDLREENIKKLTFTGIQVLDTEILNLIPKDSFCSIIDIYCKLKNTGKKIKAFIGSENSWTDIGTPDRYKKAVFEDMAERAFEDVLKNRLPDKIKNKKLKGDGSDRIWYRLSKGQDSLIVADHGIRKNHKTCEFDSFIAIGRHLISHQIPVPEIYMYDKFSGLVLLEDLGDTNLQEIVLLSQSQDKILDCYKSVINLLVDMSVAGVRQFDVSWTYQTPYYNKEIIIEYECRYFVDAFLKAYLQLNIDFEEIETEFQIISDQLLLNSINGFMHRDLQSRNIMIKDYLYYFIDFQAGRIGPIQYDLASLLIDPYVELSDDLQNHLLNYCINRLSSVLEFDPERFKKGYKYCVITRNLQMLGAFGYLTRVKGKTFFEQYIPAAVKTLNYNLSKFHKGKFEKLRKIVNRLR